MRIDIDTFLMEVKTMVKNLAIREYAKANNVKLWQIADELGITDASFSRMLRKEFDVDMTIKAKSIIDDLARNEPALEV